MNTITAEQFKQKYGSQGVASFAKPTSNGPTFGKRFMQPYKDVVENVPKHIQEGAAGYAQGMNTGNARGAVKSALTAGFRTAGDVASAVYSPISTPIGAAMDATGISKGLQRTGEYIVDKTGIADNPSVQKFAMEHSQAEQDFGRAMSLVMASADKGEINPKRMMQEARTLPGQVATGIRNTADRIGTTIHEHMPNMPQSLSPEAVMQRVGRISKLKQEKFQQTAGESVGEYLNKRDMYGDIDEITTKLYKHFENSKAQADNSLATLPGRYQPQPVKLALQDLLKREQTVSRPGAVSKDFGTITTLVQKFQDEGLSMSEINQVKRLFERNNKLDYMRQNLPDKVAQANATDDAIRGWQFKQADHLGLKNLPAINRETRLAKQLLNDIGKENAGSAGNNWMTLTDYIMLSGGDPTAISAFLLKRTLSSKGVQSAYAKKFYTGEKVGPIQANITGGKPPLPELPAPKTGAPQAENYVPIKIPPKLQSQVDASEKAFQKPYQPTRGTPPTQPTATKLSQQSYKDSIPQGSEKSKPLFGIKPRGGLSVQSVDDMKSETISETMGGWKPGSKVKFDRALMNGDAATVKNMLPSVPKSYAQSFSEKIQSLLKSKQGGAAVLSQNRDAVGKFAKEPGFKFSDSVKIKPDHIKYMERFAEKPKLTPGDIKGAQDVAKYYGLQLPKTPAKIRSFFKQIAESHGQKAFEATIKH